MSSTSRWGGRLAITATVAALALAGPVPAAAPANASPPGSGRSANLDPGDRSGSGRTVGDRVTLVDPPTTGRAAVAAPGRPGDVSAAGLNIERGPGRAGITFLTARVDGHLHVLPSDAVTAYQLPVTVQTQGDSAAAPNRSLTVEVSYDDGTTWLPAPLRAVSGGWRATVKHPADAGFVSLRAKAGDTAGNTVEQTIIRAYRLTPAD